MFQQEELKRLPVWMQINNMPLECWTTRALSKLTSKVGRPLYMDQMTRQRKRISFARVLVEIDITKAPAMTIPVMLPDGTELDLPLHFESHFKFCLTCRRMGHYISQCEALEGPQPEDNSNPRSHEQSEPPPSGQSQHPHSSQNVQVAERTDPAEFI